MNRLILRRLVLRRLTAEISRVSFAGISLLLLASGLIFSQPVSGAAISAEFVQGDVWHDTDGKPINAHGGGVLFHQDVYYWYGEFKAGKTYLPDCNKSWGGTRVDVAGVSCYSSTNLGDWKNEGIVLPAVTDDPNHDLHPSKALERPKVLYNKTTKRFVMWMHIDSASYAAARSGVAVSDKPTGPFKYLGSFRPDAGVYYWYGEFKAGKTYLPDCNKSWGGTRVDVVGVSCYSST